MPLWVNPGWHSTDLSTTAVKACSCVMTWSGWEPVRAKRKGSPGPISDRNEVCRGTWLAVELEHISISEKPLLTTCELWCPKFPRNFKYSPYSRHNLMGMCARTEWWYLFSGFHTWQLIFGITWELTCNDIICLRLLNEMPQHLAFGNWQLVTFCIPCLPTNQLTCFTSLQILNAPDPHLRVWMRNLKIIENFKYLQKTLSVLDLSLALCIMLSSVLLFSAFSTKHLAPFSCMVKYSKACTKIAILCTRT